MVYRKGIFMKKLDSLGRSLANLYLVLQNIRGFDAVPPFNSTYPEANFADVVSFPDVVLKLEKGLKVLPLAQFAGKLGLGLLLLLLL